MKVSQYKGSTRKYARFRIFDTCSARNAAIVIVILEIGIILDRKLAGDGVLLLLIMLIGIEIE